MEYYRNMKKDQIQFDFICDADSNAIPKEEIESLGGRVYIIPPYQKIFQNMKAMKKIFQDNDYPILHAYNGTMNLFPLLMGWQCRIPIRINESISMAHRSDKKTVLKKILKPLSGLATTHYAANGETCGKWQFGEKKYKEGKIEIFKTVIDPEKSSYDEKLRQTTRKALMIPEDMYVLGHIGRLTEQKNTLFLIDIFKNFHDLEPNSKLIIIGDGNLKEEMLASIQKYNLSDSVLYLGRREDIKKFYNVMDAFLLPSLYEGLPLVGVEAQNCGLPVFFSTEIPRESSPCPDLGYFIDLKKEPSYWADEIRNVLEKNKEKRRGRTEEITANGFDSKTEAEKLYHYYQKLLKNL